MSSQNENLNNQIKKVQNTKLTLLRKTENEKKNLLKFKTKAKKRHLEASNNINVKNKNKKKLKDEEVTINEFNDEQSIENKINNEPNNIDSQDNLAASNEPLSSILSHSSFESLKDKVCENTLKAIKAMGFKNLTEIQAKAIPHLLEGRDLVAKAKTGSGKTLAFLIPAIQMIYQSEFSSKKGTGCIIISPTRELAIQTYGVLDELMKYHNLTHGLVTGGIKRDIEAQKLSKGINIIVCTPGRLIDHLENTPNFVTKNLQCLVIDEADRILDDGFEKQLKQIVNLLPKKRQTMFFSATTTEKTEALRKLALKMEPVYVEVDNQDIATVDGLEQGFILCPSEKRFLLLFTFLKKNRKKKVIVFFSSCMSVKYHHELFNDIGLPVISIHRELSANERTSTFFQFCQTDSGILLCTDVAARGLDIPGLDWVIQYDPPSDPKVYIHRVGRTARGKNGKGNALLILRPEELVFLEYLKRANVPLNEFNFNWNKLADIQIVLESRIKSDYVLNSAAKDAYKAYIRAYDSYQLKEVFDIDTLDLKKVALSFGFQAPPRVDLGNSINKKIQPRKYGECEYGNNKLNSRNQKHKIRTNRQSNKKNY